MTQQGTRRFALTPLLVVGLSFFPLGCSDDEEPTNPPTSSGAGTSGASGSRHTGASGSTGTAAGGSSGSGTIQGGSSSVVTATAGASTTGGSTPVDTSSGGAAVGGTTSDVTSLGGAAMGGTTSDVTSLGGANTGGSTPSGNAGQGGSTPTLPTAGSAGTSAPPASCSANNPCGPHGTCDDSGASIACRCQAGYAGETCTECAAGHHDNGTGVCVLDQQCLGNTCSGRGTCAVNGGVVACSCDTGSTGTYCESCATSYHPTAAGACAANQTCANDSCSGHGTCADSTGVVECTCSKGYAGATCNQCAGGYHRNSNQECVLDQQCIASSCSGHGECADSNGMVACSCSAGYTGTYCAQCAAGYHFGSDAACAADQICTDTTCGAHGTCSVSTGIASCACAAGYTGATCNQCASGYHVGTTNLCELDQQCLATSCSYHGTCSTAAGLVVCGCSPEYTGSFCENCATGHHRTNTGTCELDQTCPTTPCSGHGSCAVSSGLAACTCTDGYTGTDCSQCASGYHLNTSNNCVPNGQCLESACSYHGTCSDSTKVVICSCDAGYSGSYCQFCALNYHRGADGTCVTDEVCNADKCGAHGTCALSSGLAVCNCAQGYAGTPCDQCASGYHLANGVCTVDEKCLDTTCGRHGTCGVVAGLATCSCDTGYAGANCGSCYPGYAINSITKACEVPCPGGNQIRCDGACVDGTAAEHCGSCSNTCANDAECRSSHGSYHCACTHDLCGTACVDLQTNEGYCGDCNTACTTGQKCIYGKCQSETGSCPFDCGEGVLCCNGSCPDLRQDEGNCGGCGVKCGAGQYCINGTCLTPSNTCSGSAPDSGYVCCGGTYATYVYNDTNNCGACGNQCLGSEYCNNGVCQCQWNTERCNDGCKDLRFDAQNCGACGSACKAGERCVYGVCTAGSTACGATCTADQLCCTNHDGNPPTAAAECTAISALQSSTEHCGGCNQCAAGESCNDGLCACSYPNAYCPDPANPGQNLCIPIRGDGSELTSANANCGACGNVCTGGTTCSSMGECRCQGTKPDVCNKVCTDWNTDEENCGSCGHKCDAGQMCVGDKCLTQTGTGCTGCSETELCCLNGATSSCTNVATNAANCGGCGNTCPAGNTCGNASCTPTGDLCSAPLQNTMDGFSWNLSTYSNFNDNGVYASACATADAGGEAFYLFEPSAPGTYQIYGSGYNILVSVGSVNAGNDACSVTPTTCLTLDGPPQTLALSGPTVFMAYSPNVNPGSLYLSVYRY